MTKKESPLFSGKGLSNPTKAVEGALRKEVKHVVLRVASGVFQNPLDDNTHH